MKTIAVAGAIAALAMTTPAFAQATNSDSADQATQAYARASSTAPVYTDGSAPATHPHDVVFGGRVVGRDPDPNIRFQLWREAPYATGDGGDAGAD